MNFKNKKSLASGKSLWSNQNVKSRSRVQLFATPWTVAHQAPLSMGFSRQGYRSGSDKTYVQIIFSESYPLS